MTTPLPPLAESYIHAYNHHDRAAFLRLFAESALVNDAGREFRGHPAIKAWCDREIFDANVTLEVLSVTAQNDETILITKVDGNFDRTGLPDPVIIAHHLKTHAGQITTLTCRLADNPPTAAPKQRV